MEIEDLKPRTLVGIYSLTRVFVDYGLQLFDSYQSKSGSSFSEGEMCGYLGILCFLCGKKDGIQKVKQMV